MTGELDGKDVTLLFSTYSKLVKEHTGIDVINILMYMSSLWTAERLIKYANDKTNDEEILINAGLLAGVFTEESECRFLFIVTNYDTQIKILPRGVHMRDYEFSKISHSFTLTKDYWQGNPFITNEAKLELDKAVELAIFPYRGKIMEKKIGI